MMPRMRLLLAVGGLFFAAALTAAGQDPDGEMPPVKTPPSGDESLKHWKYFLKVPLPAKAGAKLYDFVVPPVVLDHSGGSTSQFPGGGEPREPRRYEPPVKDKGLPPGAEDRDVREGLNDLRLFDAAGKEVPYVLRVRRGRPIQERLNVLGQFNPSTNDKGQIQVTLDLGPNANHNTILVRTSGSDFRRKLLIEGRDENEGWTTVLGPVELLSFRAGNQSLEVNRFEYPPSRRRYLRVTVSPDPGPTKDEPRFEEVAVFHEVQVPGEEQKYQTTVGDRQEIATDQGLDSSWTIAFGGLKVPCNHVSINARDTAFARTYQLRLPEVGGTGFRILASGVWKREAGESPKPLELKFEEVAARQLRFVVNDSRNPPLTLTEVVASAPAREVIFPAVDPKTAAAWEGPLKLYFGKPGAAEPRYDFAAHLPAEIKPPPTRIDLAQATVENNPDYRAPLTERFPWLVYVVLGAASVFLLLIIGLLARQALNRTPLTAATTR